MSGKRKLWGEESMRKAVEYVQEGGGGLRKAARLYGVPHETLRRRVSGQVEEGCRPGPCTILTKSEELRLAKYVVDMADMGFGLSCNDIRSAAYKVAEACGKPHPFHDEMAGRAWLDGFFKGIPILLFASHSHFHTIEQYLPMSIPSVIIFQKLVLFMLGSIY